MVRLKDKKYIPVVLAVLSLAVLAGLLAARYYYTNPVGVVKQPLIELKDSGLQTFYTARAGGEGDIQAKIFYPSGKGISEQEIKVQSPAVPVKIAEAVITEYLKALGDGLRDTKLLGVYRDKDNVFYIDLSDDFIRNFYGDVSQEYCLLKSLYDTVSANVAGVEDVKLLIEGKEVETIGGHLDSLYPLKEAVGN